MCKWIVASFVLLGFDVLAATVGPWGVTASALFVIACWWLINPTQLHDIFNNGDLSSVSKKS